MQLPSISVTTASLPGGTFGTTYTAPALTASGGTSPYIFAATGLPSGLTLNTATGVISGTPTQSGNFTVNVTATDATTAANGGPFTSAVKTLTLAIVASTVTVTTASLPAGTFGSGYTAPALTASGGDAPYSFSATGLPSGLTLNTATGVISGTPTQSGGFTVNVTATDATTAANGGPFTSAVKTLTLAVAAPTVTVTTASLPGGTFDTSYTAPALTASGGAAPYTFAATGLPSGLTLNTSTGVISGTPTQFGSFTINVTATDATTVANGGPFVSTTKTISLTVNSVVADGTITLRIVVAGGDGTFAFSSPSSPGLTTTISTSSGTGRSPSISLPAGKYETTITPPDGYGLTSITCSDSDSSGDAANRSLAIRLSSGEAVTCTIAEVAPVV